MGVVTDLGAHRSITGSIGYSPVKNLRFVVEGINVTDRPIEQFTDLATDRILVYTRSCRIFISGVRTSF